MVEPVWTLRFTPLFPLTLEAATDWYDTNAPEMTDALRAAVSHRLQSIQAMPTSFQRFEGTVSLAPLSRFPYFILFRIIEPATIEIVELVHSSTDSSNWSR